MFFVVLCLILYLLMALNAPFDQFGWLFLVGFGWFCGFLDGKRSLQLGKATDATVPTDEPLQTTFNDFALFEHQ